MADPLQVSIDTRQLTAVERDTIRVGLQLLLTADLDAVAIARELLAVDAIVSDDAMIALVDELAGATVQIASARR